MIGCRIQNTEFRSQKSGVRMRSLWIASETDFDGRDGLRPVPLPCNRLSVLNSPEGEETSDGTEPVPPYGKMLITITFFCNVLYIWKLGESPLL
jgi:hypothetical protein